MEENVAIFSLPPPPLFRQGGQSPPLPPSRRRGEEDNMNPVFSHPHKVLLLPEKLGATFFAPICDALKTFPKHFNPFRTIALFLNLR